MHDILFNHNLLEVKLLLFIFICIKDLIQSNEPNNPETIKSLQQTEYLPGIDWILNLETQNIIYGA
jgi:hypothetical protein